MHTIQSETLRVQVNPVGAELSGLFSTKTNTEYLWQGDKNWWGDRAPILFPIVCSMRDSKYTYKGKEYHMPKHGFVRREVFELVEAGERLVFEYRDNEKTRPLYPFAFVFRVIYELDNNVLKTTYRVENTGDETMYFSVGAHEGYNCAKEPGEAFEDYYLEFDKDADYNSAVITPENLLGGPEYSVIKNGRVLPLKHELFNNDALVFCNVPGSRVFLKSKKSAGVVEVDYTGAPHLGIWQKPGAPYVCIEPWCGLPDLDSHNGRIEEKYAINALEAGGIFNWTNTITIHEGA